MKLFRDVAATFRLMPALSSSNWRANRALWALIVSCLAFVAGSWFAWSGQTPGALTAYALGIAALIYWEVVLP